MARGGFRHLPRVAGAAIGRIAAITYVCPGCGRKYRTQKPDQCEDCGRMDFARLDSDLEADWWLRLQAWERNGKIANLRRQISYDLKTINLDNGLVSIFARYVADFTWEEGEDFIIADAKGGITDVASLKLRIMEAQGLPVRILTRKELR